MRKYVVMAALIIGTGMVAASAHAEGFHGHRGGGAIGSCIAVMSPAQKANLKSTFSAQKQTFETDRNDLMSARNALTQAILSASPGATANVSAQETALANAEAKLRTDKDALASQICSQLSPAQLNAARVLNSSLTKLRASTHAQAHAFLQTAQAAANPVAPTPGN
jgi:phosphoenolpyruvate-protein kinase (PTS system EI component)